jgi:hypothetical protein
MAKYTWQLLLGGLFVGGFIAAFVALFRFPQESVALATIAGLMVGALMLVAVLPRIAEFSVGPKGLTAKMNALQTQLEHQGATLEHQETKLLEQGEQLAQQQEIVNSLVKYGISASIFHHLCGIALLKQYVYRDSDTNRREMYFLRDNGLIQPNTDSFLDFNASLSNRNLAEIAELTPVGWCSIKLRKKDIPLNMLEDKCSLRIDPSAI